MAPTRRPDAGRRAIRILLVEPMSLLRNALAAVLSAEEDFEVVAELASFDRVAAVARKVRLDVAVLDANPAAPEDLDAVAALGVRLPECAILLLTSQEGACRLRNTVDTRAPLGAVRGLVDKDITPSQLVRDIRRVARGERVVDPRLAGALVAARNPLTRRERDVLRLAASGKPGAAIAAELRLTTGTVHNYLSTIIRKTGARNTAEAIRIATRAGWL
jgi:two-component system response regulator DesR